MRKEIFFLVVLLLTVSCGSGESSEVKSDGMVVRESPEYLIHDSSQEQYEGIGVIIDSLKLSSADINKIDVLEGHLKYLETVRRNIEGRDRFLDSVIQLRRKY